MYFIVSSYDLGNKSVLDLGCNSGWFSVQAKLLGAGTTVGIDWDEVGIMGGAIEYAMAFEKRYKFGLKFINADLDRIELADVAAKAGVDRFNVTFLLSTLHHITPPERAGTDLGVKHYMAARRPWPILYLNEWRGLTDEGLKELKGLKGLQELHLGSDNKVTDKGLAHLAGLNLKSLNLPPRAMTDEGLKQLSRFERLDWLRVGNSKMTNEGIARFRQARPNCAVYPD